MRDSIDRGFGEDAGELRCVSGEEARVVAGDAASDIGGTDAQLRVTARDRGKELACGAKGHWICEQTFRVDALLRGSSSEVLKRSSLTRLRDPDLVFTTNHSSGEFKHGR